MRPISSPNAIRRGLHTIAAWLTVAVLPVLLLVALGAPVSHLHALTAAHLLTGASAMAVGVAGVVTNTLGNYNETFFAQEALIQLEKVLGMAGRIYRGYDPNPRARGDTISLRRPSTFTAQDAPSTAQNTTTDSVSITLNKWKEVKIQLTDKDLSLSAPTLITDHIRPAAVALADFIDQDCAALYKDVPWSTTMSATPALADITAIKKVMRDNKVPLNDPTMLHFMIGSAEEAAFSNAMTTLSNPQASGLRDGSLGRLYGFDTWANQNTPTHTSGVAADAAGALNGAVAVGDRTISFDGVTIGGTFKQGDTFVITGDAQKYAFAADATADGGGAVANASITPAIKQASADNTVITITLTTGKVQNLAFHRNAFALAMAPLSELGNQLGAKIATISDPITNLALRSRMFYNGDASSVVVALDVLYGVRTLDGNLAVRGFSN